MTNQELGSRRAYDETKDRIIRGDLAGGTLLSEVQVGAELGLSRTPVHDAFLRLEGEGLVRLASRRGAVVAAMSPRESRDVLEMREAIEGAAAAAVIERAATGDAPDLGLADLIAEQHRLLAAHDFDGFIEADEAFHDRIVRASGNLIALQFWSLLRDRQQRLRYQVFSLLPETFSHAVDDHEALRTALEARDPAAFRTRLSTHVARHNGAL